jgi:1-phosphofructokinase family hexose kinase
LEKLLDIITITPNAAIDKTYIVTGFGLDRVHRPSECRSVAGGKGINVVRVLKELGSEALASGFIGGRTGDTILECLDSESLPHDFLRVKDESRLCIAVMDPLSGTQTEINENGPFLTADEVIQMLNKIRNLLAGKKYIVLSGSCPPGVPVSFYGDIIKIAQNNGVKAILDTSGDHLKEAIKASPYMVKPNIHELSQIAGRELVTLEEILNAARSLKQYDIEIVAVTMGRSGAIVTDGTSAWHAVPPTIQFASAVGSGDSFVAAFLDSIMRGEQIFDALVRGTAAGAANATTYGAGFCTKESIIDIKQGVTLTNLV